jgi:hypothetical protein
VVKRKRLDLSKHEAAWQKNAGLRAGLGELPE